TAPELLKTPGAMLTRSHLCELGLERRAVDTVFRHCPTVHLPGYSRPMIRVEDYLAYIDANTYRDDRVRMAAEHLPHASNRGAGGARRKRATPDYDPHLHGGGDRDQNPSGGDPRCLAGESSTATRKTAGGDTSSATGSAVGRHGNATSARSQRRP